MYNNNKTNIFRQKSFVAIEHSTNLSEMIAAYKTVISALGIKISKKCEYACRDYQLVYRSSKTMDHVHVNKLIMPRWAEPRGIR